MTETPVLSCRLDIQNGPQAGACIRLTRGLNCVGRDLANDIVIADLDLEERHFEIEVGDAICLVPRTGLIYDDLNEVAGDGGRFLVGHATGFRAGQTHFLLVPDAPIVANCGRSRKGVKSAIGLSAILAAAAIFILSASAEPKNMAHASQALALTAAVTPVARQAPQISGSFVAEKFSLELRRVGLSQVAVAPGSEGTITAAGLIDGSQRPLWDTAQRWFDAQFGTRFVLIDRLSSVKSVAPLSVAAVWTGSSPYVINQRGEKLFPGSVLPTGWRIDTIHSDRLLLSRVGQMLVVRF